jgi:chromosome partitioning protein
VRESSRLIDQGKTLNEIVELSTSDHNSASIIAIANQRSGVGKTGLALSMGTSLASRGHRILLVDLDPKASLTAFCGFEDTHDPSIAELLGGALPGKVAMWDILRSIDSDLYLFLAPSNIGLAQTELGMLSRLGREKVLARALKEVQADFDLVLIDCPPGFGMLPINALTAANAVLIPTRPSLSDLRGLWFFLSVVEKIRAELNEDLDVLGVLATTYDRRIEHHVAAIAAMKAAGIPLLPVGLEEHKRLESGEPSEEPIPVHIPSNLQAQEQLAFIIEEWMGLH